ncbi:ATP-binding protein [Candidatus Micrarchaeota archaeon]|nr:ATP-binding protein [Candidatus Micrarchaeota archaeon]
MYEEAAVVMERASPWWTTGAVDKPELGVARPAYLKDILHELDSEMILVLTGIRRCGKTTLVKQAIQKLVEKGVNPKQILYLSLEAFEVKQAFKSITEIADAFSTIAGGGKLYLFLDEVHYFQDWETQVKTVFDRFKKRMKIVVSGSSATLLKSKKATALTGRNVPITVFPFSFCEFVSLKNPNLPAPKDSFGENNKIFSQHRDSIEKMLYEYLAYGGFPQICTTADAADKKKYLQISFDDIIFKDVTKVWEIKDVNAISNLALYLLQSNCITQRFSYRKISAANEMDINTAMNYAGYLNFCYLFFFTEFYSKSLANRFRKEKKVFTIDTGLSNARFPTDNFGPLAENAVFLQLLRTGRNAFYWKNNHEVDLVTQEFGKQPLPIEVKYQNEINKEDFKGLNSFFKHFDKANRGIMVTKNKFETVKTKDGQAIQLVPLWLFLLSFQSGYNERQEYLSTPLGHQVA